MRNKYLVVSMGFVCLLVVSQSLWGQDAPRRGIRGYVDPQTGTFRILPQPRGEEAAPPSTSVFAGKFVFDFTITVDATISATAKIACTATAIVEDNLSGGSPNIIQEQASALAVRSGSTATCTVNIPYSWNLVTGSTDTVMLSYTIAAPAEASVTTALPSRYSTQENFVSIKVPASGTTTTETVTATF